MIFQNKRFKNIAQVFTLTDIQNLKKTKQKLTVTKNVSSIVLNQIVKINHQCCI